MIIIIYILYFINIMSSEDIKEKTNYWKNKKPNDRCNIKQTYKNGSCFPEKVMYRIGSSLGLNMKKVKGKKSLIKEIKNKLNCDKNIDSCISEHIDPNITLKFLKPEHPEYIWLSTLDIIKVLKNYENKYSNFKCGGVLPLDFNLNSIVNNFLKLYKNGYKKFGYVFNTSYSYEEGTHWVSMFVKISNNEAYVAFFDSVGDPPLEEIFKLMKRLNYVIKNKLNKNSNILINHKEHQLEDGECGVYSLNFIIQCLNGMKPQKVFNKVIHDNSMAKNRGIFFRKRE